MFRTTVLDYDARRKPKTDYHCVACQLDLDPAEPHRVVWMVGGEADVVHPDDVQEAISSLAPRGYVEVHPIGPDCAAKLGLEWSGAKP